MNIKNLFEDKDNTSMEDLEVIEKLSELMYKGFIPDEEYKTLKKKILNLD